MARSDEEHAGFSPVPAECAAAAAVADDVNDSFLSSDDRNESFTSSSEPTVLPVPAGGTRSTGNVPSRG